MKGSMCYENNVISRRELKRKSSSMFYGNSHLRRIFLVPQFKRGGLGEKIYEGF